ncbi:DNA-directed RNA polymerase [Streptomyces laurentii]|uniref:DNA-directed RNA polymerase n=1 Tax=Streptomyces laurentii TaxID=39478 RepID=A0A160NYX3_STRLU|nr:DNA-directed RNA polymerase [Streptomyces laurentii]
MATPNYEALARDLFGRTEKAIDMIAALSVDTGITFKISDIVQRVEDGLPEGYPDSTNGEHVRRDLIAEMARDALSGAAYED